MPTDLDSQIASALGEIVAARNAAAAPLHFTAEADKASNDRSVTQFRATLPKVTGGFATVRDGLLRASTLFGTLAKAIAQSDDPAATQINVQQMSIARAAAEKACRLTLAKQKNKSVESVGAADGLICN